MARIPMKFAAQGAATAHAVPPPPVPFPGWIASSQCAGRPESPAASQQEPPALRQVADAFTKTRPCRFYPRCNKGDACRFAHAPEEIRARPNMTKTRMCAGFYDGRCKLEPHECDFAHGEEDLRQREVPYFGPMNKCRGGKAGDATPTTSAPPPGSMWGRPTRRGTKETIALSVASSTCGDSTPRVLAANFGSSSESSTEVVAALEEDLANFGLDEGSLAGERGVATNPVEAIFADWMAQIRSMSAATVAGKKVDDGRTPTPYECLVALTKVMPERYED